MFVLSVHFNLIELCELYVVVSGAEFLDLCNGAGSLASELVAWEIQDFESLLVIFLIDSLQIPCTAE